MKYLITGGAGFVGSQLGRRLAVDGHDVVLLDDLSFGHLDNLLVDGRQFARFVCRDIRDPRTAELYDGVDCVFHLAGIAALLAATAFVASYIPARRATRSSFRPTGPAIRARAGRARAVR